MKDFIKHLVSEMLPGVQMDEDLAERTLVCKVDGWSFQQLDQNYGDGLSGNSLVIGLRADEDFGLLTGGEPTGKNIGVFVNGAGIGQGKRQEPEKNVVYGFLHELVELKVVPASSTIKNIACQVNADICGREDISSLTKSRFSVPHLEAVGMEYQVALTTGKAERKGLLEAGRLHRTVNRALRERADGQGTPDIWARHFMLKRIFQEKKKIPNAVMVMRVGGL